MTFFSINWYSLRIYVDSFQGCYKDGTEPGTFDCRWFSALMLLTRSFYFVIYGLTLSMMSFAYVLIVIATILILLINIQPYKKTAVRYPSTDTTFFVLLALLDSAILGMGLSFIKSNNYPDFSYHLCHISMCPPLLYYYFHLLLANQDKETEQCLISFFSIIILVVLYYKYSSNSIVSYISIYIIFVYLIVKTAFE